MVESIARRVHRGIPPNSGLDHDDLTQAGFLGLLIASRCYDPAMAVPFWVYAQYRVRGEILDSLRRHDSAPRSLRRWQKKLTTARTDLAGALHRNPTEEELCDRLVVSTVEMRSRRLALRQTQGAALKDEMHRGTGPEAASGPETDPNHLCAQRQVRKVLHRLINGLPTRQRLVILQHYTQHKTMKEIGAVLGVNESRVSQMHQNALRRMERWLKNSGICSRSLL